jgi:hypothetical protein
MLHPSLLQRPASAMALAALQAADFSQEPPEIQPEGAR